MLQISILQIPDVENNSYVFMNFKFAKEHGFSILDYKTVYEYTKTDNIWLDDTDTLDEIFTIFNCSRPDDFKGRSLSTSDIVILNNRMYYVDSFGFQRII